MTREEFTSSTTWSVPSDVDEVIIECNGEDGEDRDESGGPGGYTEGKLDVTNISTLYINVAVGGGARGQEVNYSYYGGYGGGASDVRVGGDTLDDRVIVAGGGGGGGKEGGDSNYTTSGGGYGGGGNAPGGDGGDGNEEGGYGGTLSSGGVGGSGSGVDGEDGSFGYGGDGGDAQSSDTAAGGGGGGGGYYGGGGGGGSSLSSRTSGSGGGGSGYIGDVIYDSSGSNGGSQASGGMVALEYYVDPDPPTDLSATVNTDSIDLTWTDNAGNDAEEIRIYRENTSNVSLSDPYATLSPGSESYTDTIVSDGTSYFYVVSAWNSSYESESAEIGTATMPAALSASGGSSSVSLDWSHDANAVGNFYICRAESSGSRTTADYSQVGSTSSTSYTDSGLTDGRTYYYRVYADASDAQSPLSDESNTTTDLPSPTLSSTSGGDRQVSLSFQAEDNNSDGVIEIHRDGSFVADRDRDAESYTDTGTDLDGEQYEHHIVRDTGDATASSGTLSAVTDLPPVTDLAVETIDGRYVTLSWLEQSNNTDTYDVLLDEDANGTHTVDGSRTGVGEGQTATYETTELLDGQLYEATVESFTAHTSTREDA